MLDERRERCRRLDDPPPIRTESRFVECYDVRNPLPPSARCSSAPGDRYTFLCAGGVPNRIWPNRLNESHAECLQVVLGIYDHMRDAPPFVCALAGWEVEDQLFDLDDGEFLGHRAASS